MSRYYARNPFVYDGQNLSRGQVFEFGGNQNDEKLERLRYCVPVEKKAEVYECGECGASFVNQAFRTAHGKVSHPSRPFTEREIDRMLDQQDKEMTNIYPLALEKSLAN